MPVLWDTQNQTIVNNESSEIIRMLNSEFNELAGVPLLNLCPAELVSQIDEINGWVYDMLNNGVYKAGFATAQDECTNNHERWLSLSCLDSSHPTSCHVDEKNAKLVWEGLQRVEAILGRSSFLTGNSLTEADIRLYTTILRFDPVYFGHFKCNLLAVRDCPNILRWLREVTAIEGVKETINMEHIKVDIMGLYLCHFCSCTFLHASA